MLWDVDWSTVSWHSDDPDRMQRVLRAWDDHLAHPSLPRVLAAHLGSAGFTDVEVQGHSFVAAEYTQDAYGVATIPVVERYVAGHEAVGPEVAAAWSQEQRALGERGAFFFACLQFAVAAVVPPADPGPELGPRTTPRGRRPRRRESAPARGRGSASGDGSRGR